MTEPTANPMTPETEARMLRDYIYGKQNNPNNWDACKEHWINDLPWLRAQATKHQLKKI